MNSLVEYLLTTAVKKRKKRLRDEELSAEEPETENE